eukprot:8057125-Pyramimonas_sp.AAC.1
MRAATVAGCDFWVREQGAVMCPQTIPRMAILATRAVGGRLMYPEHNIPWTHSPLEKLAGPRSQCAVCDVVPVATPAAKPMPMPPSHRMPNVASPRPRGSVA